MKVCIDIGTTTICLLGINPGSQLVIEENILNQQRFLGADVISRIKASMEGSAVLLKSMIQRTLIQGIQSLTKKCGLSTMDITEITAAGNTTMVHLLMGYSCQGLAAYPFSEVYTEAITCSANKLLDTDLFSCNFTLFPGISAFIGGDILSGMLALSFDETEELSLFLDLGTNGEMALGTKDHILTTSTAAGPAFEGINITCGMAAVKGAINQLSIAGQRVRYQTVQYGTPSGICGSGIIDLCAELLRTNLIDDTGLLKEPHFTEGFLLASPQGHKEIRFFQSDIRQVQTAKAAIRSGIELLIQEYGCFESDISKVYLAGSFGSAANISNAVKIGLLPTSLEHKISICGNTSLKGTLLFQQNNDSMERLIKIKNKSSVLYLANTPDFESVFLKYMNF